ncbi:thermonuclease family protein [Azospirillum sp.]|uniref:thermonuclease family protein n=1 Tax=Azospirillum sp. TaxID=34012 RepID=UPI003D732732
MLVRLLVVLSALLLAAAAPADRLASAGRGRVAAVLDGDTFDLDDGRRVRLAGIEAAKPPPGREQERRWPLAEAATRALKDLAQGRTVELRGAGVEDRYGRLLVHAVREDGLWLQGELLKRGHARVLTRPDARDLAPEMLVLEAEARAAKRGVWSTRVYAVRSADDLDRLRRDRDSVQLVEGRVVKASKVKGQVYLNFGEDWRSDVSVHVGRDALKLFARVGLDPLALEGAIVRVRGWVSQRNGPMIEATHPEQVEVVEAAGPLPNPPPLRGGGNSAAPPPPPQRGGGMGRGQDDQPIEEDTE